MIDNDEGYPTGAEDHGYFAISHCSSCPDCGNNNVDAIWDSEIETGYDYTLTERVCLVCEAKWYERDFDEDEWIDDEQN